MFDPSALLDNARNHLNLITDEIELMQTSPEYMRQHALEMKKGLHHDIHAKKITLDEEWQKVSSIFMAHWISQASMWQRIVVECEDLHAVMSTSMVTSERGSHLSRGAELGIEAFTNQTGYWQSLETRNLVPKVYSMAVMREFFNRVPDWQTDRAWTNKRIEQCCDPSILADRIFFHTMLLGQATLVDSPYGSEAQLSCLIREIADAPHSSVMSFTLSSISLLDELRVSAHWHQLIGTDTREAPAKETLRAEETTRSMLPSDFDPTSAEYRRSCDTKTLRTLKPGQLLRQFCEVSVPAGGKNVVWLKQITQARACLSDFWQSIRDDFTHRQIMIKRDQAWIDGRLARMSFDKSSKYLDELKAERRQIEAADRDARALKLSRSAPFVRQTWDTMAAEEGPARRKLTKKAKASQFVEKTQTEIENLTLDGSQEDAVDGSDHESISQAHIPVKQDSLSVFSKLFPPQTATAVKGDVRWTRFVQALTDAGMVATQGAGGSAVIFVNNQGRIRFHKPHPESTIDARLLPDWGKRLRNWFGWSNETFVLREKAAASAGAEEGKAVTG